MSSRGSLAKNGHITDDEYKTIDILLHNEKIIDGIGRNHSMPEYSHSKNAVYIIYKKGIFHAMRIYGKDHMPIIEIAYHPEPNLNNGDRLHSIWHMHRYLPGLDRQDPEYISDKVKKKYKDYLEDIGYDQW